MEQMSASQLGKKSLMFLQQFAFSYYNIYLATIIISGVNSVSIKSLKKYKMLRGGGGVGAQAHDHPYKINTSFPKKH